ncbi:hypothetical protein GA0074695_4013 [Micromonospora viridifaciens]|uniref:Uncharacterized protein n=1 Tax=Micromonospora viridifaciens TaxID=1881 RepID=A0A1C4YA92_MICVI|nr:hypothetical protein [Micromonospora viridifaciens]SCF17637.1 hypothetical protein GA0074695_4013 [Micromonospora viridifaciens]
MSDASTDRDDRPAEVSDPLLWRLATAVADTHQPDENGACDNGSCFGAAWPCAAWNRAQEGLRAAQSTPRTAGTERALDQDPSADRGRPAPQPTPPQSDRAPVEVTPAA